MTRPVDPRAGRLRSLERLRSGLPPSGAAELVSVGTGNLTKVLDKFLDDRWLGGRGIAIIGTYGAGKSHALTILRDMATGRNMASCWVSADAADSALNHPQRFLCGMLQTMVAPGRVGGYAELVTGLLEDEAKTKELTAAIDETFFTSARSDEAIRSLVRVCAWHHKQRTYGDDVFASRDQLVRLLSGETLVGAPGAEYYRAIAYRTLELAVKTVRIAGYGGLVMVVDEVESVFTKLPSVLSRYGAFRVLAALLCGLEAHGLKVALAMTPDAWEMFAVEVRASWRVTSCLSNEPVVRLQQKLTTILGHSCEALPSHDLTSVMDKVRRLYYATHGDVNENEAEWRKKLIDIGRRHTSMRLAIREVMDHLDGERFARCAPQ